MADQDEILIPFTTSPIGECCKTLYKENQMLCEQIEHLKDQNSRLHMEIAKLTQERIQRINLEKTVELISTKNGIENGFNKLSNGINGNSNNHNGHTNGNGVHFEIADDSSNGSSYANELPNPAEMLNLTLSEEDHTFKLKDDQDNDDFMRALYAEKQGNRRKQSCPRPSVCLKQNLEPRRNSYPILSGLKQHQPPKPPAPRRKSAPQAVRCPICDQYFSFVTNYYRHCRMVHQITGKTPRPIRCEPKNSAITIAPNSTRDNPIHQMMDINPEPLVVSD